MGGQFIFNYTFYNILIALTIFYITKLISNVYYNTKKFFSKTKSPITILLLNNTEVHYLTLTQIVLINSFKTLDCGWGKVYNLIFFLLFFFLIFNYFYVLLTKSIHYYNYQINLVHNLGLWFYLSIAALFLIDNFITLLLLLEFISLLYYFFFLEQSNNSQVSFIKLKNLLNVYLWLSWFTLIFFYLTLLKISAEIGTLNFNEIHLLYNYITPSSWCLLFFAFFFKLGISGFHILKFQVYQYISPFFLMLFSMFTFFLNSTIFLFLFLKLYSVFFLYQKILLNFVLFSNFVILLSSFRVTSFSQFLAVSTINVWSLIFLCLCL